MAGAAEGPLAGLTFAAKDLFDVAGHTTGSGNPTWLATHPPATATAPAVKALLDAGARLVGKTITDELAFSINGENAHYGTPLNTEGAAADPRRLIERLGFRRGRRGRAAGAGDRYRRFRPRAGRVLRDLRLPPDPWPHSAGWRDAAGAQLRRGRLVHP